MNARYATEEEIAIWDSHVITNPDGGDYFQTTEFAAVKEPTGWTPCYVVVDTIYVLVLQKIVFPLGKIWYIPKGPGVSSLKELSDITPTLREFAHSQSAFTIKIEPKLLLQETSKAALSKLGIVEASYTQPTYSTIIINIDKDIDALIAGFSSKTRYNIRQAEKAGVVCREVEATDENCRIFYNMFAETASGRFGIRSFDYYKRFWQAYCNNKAGKIMFAFLDDEVVSAEFIMILSNQASRKDAASPRQKPVRGAAALLVLESIRALQADHITSYDLCGSPSSSDIKNHDHHLYGIGQFKAGFSEDVTDYMGVYEIPVRTFSYKVWARIGERIVRRIHRYKHHDSYY